MDRSPRAPQTSVEAVDRALTILTAFRPSDRIVPLAELARRTGFHKSTILRLIGSLQGFAFLERDEVTGGYRIGPGAWRIGKLFDEQLHLEDHLRPLLIELAKGCDESASFYVPEMGPEKARICLMREDSEHFLRDHIKVGDRLPFDQGAGGRMLRAFLAPEPGDDEVVARGFYLSYGERRPEIAAVAAPVMRGSGAIAGAITLSAPTSRRDRAWFEAHVAAVVAVARRATAALADS